MTEKPATFGARWPRRVESAVSTDKSNGSALLREPNSGRVGLAPAPYLVDVGLKCSKELTSGGQDLAVGVSDTRRCHSMASTW
jgi:hypothetical protein